MGLHRENATKLVGTEISIKRRQNSIMNNSIENDRSGVTEAERRILL